VTREWAVELMKYSIQVNAIYRIRVLYAAIRILVTDFEKSERKNKGNHFQNSVGKQND
jgi:hypothetical protein